MLLFQFFIHQSDSSILSRINNNRYKSTDLVQIKIPVHLAIEDWTDFEPISGQVQLKDNSYNYAELKMTRDTMYLMCIPNHDKTRLVNANIIYAKQVSDIPMNKKSQVPLLKKSISKSEYQYSITYYQAFIPEKDTKFRHNRAFSNIVNTSIDVPGQPPEASSFFS